MRNRYPPYRSMARSASEASTAPCWRVSPDKMTRPSFAFTKLKSSCICFPPICPASSTITTEPGNHPPPREKFRNGLGIVKALFQIQNLLALRRDDVRNVTGGVPVPISRNVWLLPVPAPPQNSATKSREPRINSAAAR